MSHVTMLEMLLKASRKAYSKDLGSNEECVKTRFAFYNFRKKYRRDVPQSDYHAAINSVVISIKGSVITFGPDVSINRGILDLFTDDNDVLRDTMEHPETIPFTDEYNHAKLGMPMKQEKTKPKLPSSKEALAKLGFHDDRE